MINEIRTLLLNEDLSGHPFAEPAPPAFAGVPLDSSEMAVRRHLCNPAFRPRTRNILATAIFKVASEHRLFPRTGLDKKIALVSSPPPMEPGILVSGFGSEAIRVSGAFAPKEDIGLFSESWNISRVDSTHVFIFEAWSGSTTSELVTFSNSMSGVIPIFDSGLSFRFFNYAAVPTISAKVEAFAPVSFNIQRVLDAARADGAVTGIFGLADSTTGRELRSDFYSSTSPSIAIAALALSYALHIREKIGS